jgi:tetratricopeptide (TPR) repeat protein
MSQGPTPIPLRYRLVNPPQMIGRRELSSRLARSLEREPVFVVWGLGGLGKTALVAHTLHEAFPQMIARTVFVRAPTETEDLRHEILRAIATALDLKLDWSLLLKDVEGALATAIDLAERGPYFVVVDDVHRADAQQLHDTLLLLSRYARSSRWVFTSRTDPHVVELRATTMMLAPMSEEELSELARALVPSTPPERAKQLAELAAGSPWRLKQLVLAPDGSENVARGEDILAGLDDATTHWLRCLASIEHRIPIDTLATVAPPPSAETLHVLERRGLIERAASEARVHDVARPLLRASLRRDESEVLSRSMAAVLATSDAPGAILEALGLWFGHGNFAEAKELLTKSLNKLLSSGYVSETFKLLDRYLDRSLVGEHLEVALELGSTEVLERVVRPEAPTPAQELLWARSSLLRLRLQDAIHSARAARQRDPGLTFEASLVEARALATAGNFAEACDLLKELTPADDDARVRRDMLFMRTLVFTGDLTEALDRLELARRSLERLSPPTRRQVGADIVVTLIGLGRIRAASEAFRAWVGSDDEPAIELLHAQERLHVEARLEIELGRMAHAAKIIQQLLTIRSSQSLAAQELDIRRAIITGEFEGIDSTIDALIEEALRTKHVDLALLGFHHRLRSSMFYARREIDLSQLPMTIHPVRAIIEGWWADLRVRYGETKNLSEGGFPWTKLHEGAKVVFLGAEANEALLNSDGDQARRKAQQSVEVARQHGLVTFELPALSALADILLCDRKEEDALRAVDELAGLATRCDSLRLLGEVNFYRAVLGAQVETQGVLAVATTTWWSAPVACRRARALLGADVALDRVDERVLAAIRARHKLAVSRPVPSAPFDDAWVIDSTRKKIYFAQGPALDLTSKALLLRILEVLAECGGVATKEELATQVWELRGYHALRDDKRMQVAIRKLRLLLEVDPSDPTRVVTTDTGYALGPAASWLRSR